MSQVFRSACPAQIRRRSSCIRPSDPCGAPAHRGRNRPSSRRWSIVSDSITQPHPGLIKRHAETVIRFSRLRQIQKFADRIRRHTAGLGADPDQLLEQMAETVDALQAGYDIDGNLLPYEPCPSSRRPEILTLSQVEGKEVDWLWRPYLPNGMLAMLSGDPGAGKTYIALAIAAAITTGREPCSGQLRKPADVLCLSVENSPPRKQVRASATEV